MNANPQSNISFFSQRIRNIDLDLSLNELTAVIHALEDDYEHIRSSGGDRYGMLSLEELHLLIGRLHKAHPYLPAAAAH